MGVIGKVRIKLSITNEKAGFITPEKEYKKLILWGLLATLISGLFAYIDYSSPQNAEFNQLIVTEGTLIKGYGTAQLQTTDNKIIYFPLSGGKSGQNYGISFKEFYNHKVKIWWYSKNLMYLSTWETSCIKWNLRASWC